MLKNSNKNNQRAKYDIHRNPVYQIDHKNLASGKLVSASKRRVTWRFGFSDARAIRDGMTGSQCRGEEHEITLIWSLTSGKRVILADGIEVHYSTAKITDSNHNNNKFEASWIMRGGHILKIVAHVAPTLFTEIESRQFDLFIDRMSFFDLPHIFQLGKFGSSSSPNKSKKTSLKKKYPSKSQPKVTVSQLESGKSLPNLNVIKDESKAVTTKPTRGSSMPQISQSEDTDLLNLETSPVPFPTANFNSTPPLASTVNGVVTSALSNTMPLGISQKYQQIHAIQQQPNEIGYGYSPSIVANGTMHAASVSTRQIPFQSNNYLINAPSNQKLYYPPAQISHHAASSPVMFSPQLPAQHMPPRMNHNQMTNINAFNRNSVPQTAGTAMALYGQASTQGVRHSMPSAAGVCFPGVKQQAC